MDPGFAEVLMRAKPPYNVNQAAEAALLASLEDVDALQARVRRIVAARARMHGLPEGADGLTPPPRHATFTPSPMPHGPAPTAARGRLPPPSALAVARTTTGVLVFGIAPWYLLDFAIRATNGFPG